MIIHHGLYYASASANLAESLDLGVGFLPPQEASHKSLLRWVSQLTQRTRFVDPQWYQDVGLEKDWVQETYGLRADLRTSQTARLNLYERIASEIPDGPLTSIASAVNDDGRSREYA